MTRRFVALGVDDGVRTALDRSLVGLRDRFAHHAWTDPAGWHVTLAFVGELSDERLPDLEHAVRRGVASPALDPPGAADTEGDGAPVRVALGQVDRLGPRVLVVRIVDDPPGRLASLGEAIRTELDGARLPVERRPLQPHVTLARARRRGRMAADVVAGVAAALPGDLAWSPATVGVWSSRSGAGPARYDVAAEVALSS